jgi:hypothetical protein
LRLTRQADFVFCFYDPSSTNNIYASPCKVFEALGLGTPVLLNSEIKLANWLSDLKVAIIIDYLDVDKLGNILKNLTTHRATLANREVIENLYREHFSWEIAFAALNSSLTTLGLKR